MTNEKDHDHRAAQDGLVEYKRTVDGAKQDSGVRLRRDELAGSPQQYVDHAGRPTTVKEYKSGAADVFVGDDQPRYWAKERIVSEAQQLASSSNWKVAGDRFTALLDQWKSVGTIDKRVDDQLWRQFDSARTQFKDARQQHFDDLKRTQASAVAEKSRIVSRVETLVHTADSKAAAEEVKRLMDEWKRAGRCERSEEERLWARFDDARKQIQARRTQEFEKRKAEWSANKAAKERLISRAESLANGSDLKAASDSMRSLGDEWKRIGPCDKSDNDKLWAQFNAARSRLTERKTREFERRTQEWAANRSAKERIVSQAESLASSSDLRSAGDAMRSLTDQWKQTGPCEKADNERLWSRFDAAKTKLRERKQQDFENRKAERRGKAYEYISRLEDQLRNVESALYRANESYSKVLSARSPSMNNPNWYSISQKQLQRQSDARSRIASLGMRKSEIVNKLMSAKSQASSL